MIRSINDLKKYDILTTDGEFGSTEDFYFDDHDWTLRYLVVKTGIWFMGEEVLITPHVLRSIEGNTKNILVNLTQEQVRNSPDVDTKKPISEQEERPTIMRYRGVAPIWGGDNGMTGVPVGATHIASNSGEPAVGEKTAEVIEEKTHIPNLRSANEVIGYHIQASDGEIGHVEDFLVDDQTWNIHYMVIDTHNWLPGKKVLVAPKWIQGVAWANHKVRVSITQEAVKDSPEYDPKLSIDEAYEQTLHRYYDQWHI